MGKGQTRFTGFDDKIISMYARGMSTREIQGHLEEIYGVEVSPTLISNVTEAVMEEVKTLAEPAAGCGLSDRVPGRAGGEDSRRRARSEQGDLRGDRRQHEGATKKCWGCGRAQSRGSEVLAAGADGAEEPRGGGYLHRLRGWAEGISRGD